MWLNDWAKEKSPACLHTAGKSQTEKELLSPEVVRNLRDQLKITTDYFSMLVVGKDGEVKAWFPTAMWSLSNIYDLVDSMELRQQEQELQQTLGIHCPEDSHGVGGGTHHGYTREAENSYLYHRSEDWGYKHIQKHANLRCPLIPWGNTR